MCHHRIDNKKLILIILGVIITPTKIYAQTINPATARRTDFTAGTSAAFTTLAPIRPSGIIVSDDLDFGYSILNPVVDPVIYSPDSMWGEMVDYPAAGEPLLTGKEIVGNEIIGSKRWRIRPIFAAGVLYDDNIYISRSNRQADAIFTTTAGLVFELGDYRNLAQNYLQIAYNATGFFYVDHPKTSACNQNAFAFGQYCFNKTIVQFKSQYQNLTGPDRDVGNFSKVNAFDNGIRFYYDYSDRTRMEFEVRQLSYVYQNYFSSYECYEKLSVDYFLTAKLSLGIEGRLGQLAVEGSPFQIYEQIRAQCRFELTGKIFLKANCGVDIRQYTSGGRSAWATPIFGLGLEYKPFVDTLVLLEGYRNVLGAAVQRRQDFIATGVVLNVQQVLFHKLALGLAVGYENDTYVANATNTYARRRDNYVFIRPNLACPVFWWMIAGIYYQYQQNFSNINRNSFYDNQVGFEIALRF